MDHKGSQYIPVVLVKLLLWGWARQRPHPPRIKGYTKRTSFLIASQYSMTPSAM